jgi:acetyl-CoA synthetase
MAEDSADSPGDGLPGAPATIEDYFSEDRVFTPSESFRHAAVVGDPGIYERAEADWTGFWAEQAGALDWFRTWDTVLEWDLPFARWFDGGTLNVSYNCLDRHVAAGRGDTVAFHWEGEPGDTRTITYAQLLTDVSRFANVLRGLGVGRGDRVAVYMPMIPELAVAMLACTRIGAVHSVVFGGFSSDALRDRILDAQARVVLTADGGFRRGAPAGLKANVDVAVSESPCVDHVVVARRTSLDDDDARPPMAQGRDHWWHELLSGDDPAAGGIPADECPPEHMDAEDLLFILYTSGTTAAPKGIMHTTGGYLTQVAFTHRSVFDLHPERDVYWCAADIGWVTGHSYIVYGPLANGATSVMYEGTPDFPERDRWWSIVERYGVGILYAAPTAIRTFMKWGTEYPGRHDLSSLRVLGSVGEPINPEAWMWYSTVIGGGHCPVTDTWWQTETGAMMIAPLPGVTPTKPGSATLPLPGIGAEVVDEEGRRVDTGGGYLTLTRPWPSMLRGIYGDPERYRDTYWSRFPGRYFAGDGAKVDEDGYLWLLGRVDDVMNVSGHRISTTEVESALVDHPLVAESAVVGANDPTTGQSIVAFVSLVAGTEPGDELGQELRAHVAEKIGPIARPKTVVFTDELPKTRSGKIMRRLLRDVAEGRVLGDTTTLADPAVVEEIRRLSSVSPADE